MIKWHKMLMFNTQTGRLAQLVEHLNDIQGVTSSSLVTSTIFEKTRSKDLFFVVRSEFQKCEFF